MDPKFEVVAIHVEGDWIDIDEDRPAPSRSTTSAVAVKVKDGTKTALPAPTPSAISAICSASVPFATVIASRAPQNSLKTSFQLGDFRPHDELAMVDDAGDARVDFRAQTLRLILKTRECYSHRLPLWLPVRALAAYLAISSRPNILQAVTGGTGRSAPAASGS